MEILKENTSNKKEVFLSKEGKRIYLIIFFLLCLGALRLAYNAFVAPPETKSVFQSEKTFTSDEEPADVLDIPNIDNYNE